MQFLIDIEDSSGNKQGPGPVHTALSWTHTARLNRAGKIQLDFIATDSRADEVQQKRIARCYAVLSGTRTDLGAGIIDKFVTSVPSQSQVNFSVDGNDLLRELAYRTVGNLQITASSASLAPRKAYYHKPSTQQNFDLVTASPIVFGASEYIYIGYYEPFDAVTLTISVGNTNTGTMTGQYFQEDQIAGKWTTVAITDGTAAAGAPLGQTGTVSWTRPTDGAQMTHGGDKLYWFRLLPGVMTTSVTFTAYAITGDGEATTGPADIIAFAPAGWSLDTATGYDSTTKAVKITFEGESVLAALVKLSELTGERFRLGSGRKLVWIRNDETSSGVRAFRSIGDAGMDDETSVCVIQSLQQEIDTHENYIGRIYAEGKDDLTLENTTKVAGTGWTLGNDSKGYYLQHDATWTAYGIDTWKAFNTIIDPNELYELAYEYVELRRDTYNAYSLEVVGLKQIVYPGDTIFVEYRRIIDGYEAYDISGTFVILEVTTRIDQNGIKIESLKVASSPRYPDSANEALAGLLI